MKKEKKFNKTKLQEITSIPELLQATNYNPLLELIEIAKTPDLHLTIRVKIAMEILAYTNMKQKEKADFESAAMYRRKEIDDLLNNLNVDELKSLCYSPDGTLKYEDGFKPGLFKSK